LRVLQSYPGAQPDKDALSRKRSRDQPLLLKKALQPDSLMLRKNKYRNSCSNISQIPILAYRECFQSRLLEIWMPCMYSPVLLTINSVPSIVNAEPGLQSSRNLK
jgi:hypothetical protein